MVAGSGDGFELRSRTKLLANVFDVAPHRMHTEIQLAGNLRRIFPPREQPQDLGLSWRQPRGTRRIARSRGANDFAARATANDADDVSDRALLGQQRRTAGSDDQTFERRIGMSTDENHNRCRGDAVYSSDAFDTVDIRHLPVHDDDIGAIADNGCDGFADRGDSADALQAVDALEGHAEGLTVRAMIVNDQRPGRGTLLGLFWLPDGTHKLKR